MLTLVIGQNSGTIFDGLVYTFQSDLRCAKCKLIDYTYNALHLK